MYDGVSRSFRTESITEYTLTFGIARCCPLQRVMAAKLTRLTHKIAIQLHQWQRAVAFAVLAPGGQSGNLWIHPGIMRSIIRKRVSVRLYVSSTKLLNEYRLNLVLWDCAKMSAFCTILMEYLLHFCSESFVFWPPL
jgi:hypothetical protein